jgi:hypothetical protein
LVATGFLLAVAFGAAVAFAVVDVFLGAGLETGVLVAVAFAAGVFFTGAAEGLALAARGFFTGSARGSTLIGGPESKSEPSLSKCEVIELRALEMAANGSSLGSRGVDFVLFFENMEFNADFRALNIVLQIGDRKCQA